jgi:hypothetical protein
VFTGVKGFLWEDGRVWRADGCTTVWVNSMPLSWTLKIVKMLCEFYHNKKLRKTKEVGSDKKKGWEHGSSGREPDYQV